MVRSPVAPPSADPASAIGPGVELQLLGAASLRVAGRPIDPGARKGLALLAWLAVAGRSTRARLAAMFWPEGDAASARRNLRRELHRLRCAGADGVLVASGDTLSLAPGVDVDALVFERALACGEVGQALDAYAGPFLDGFDLASGGDFEGWAASQRERLALRHREATQAMAELHRSQNRLQEALALTLRLIDLDTLHEQHFRQAMELHAALGDRESALKLYERCRLRLGRDLGLRPMPATIALADALRRGDPVPGQAAQRGAPASDRRAIATGSATGSGSGMDEPPFVGRRRWMAELDTTGAGAPGALTSPTERPIWLSGEPGVGKSRLAREHASRRGPCWWVQALAGDATQPYATVARALRGLSIDPQALPAWARRALTRLLPEWAPPALGTTEVAGAAEPTDPRRLHAALALVWPTAAAGLQTVVLDDWHLADAASQACWAATGQPTDAQMPVLPVLPVLPAATIVVTVRAGEMPPLQREAVQQARYSGACRWLDVPPLDEDEWPDLVQALGTPALPPGAARRLYAVTGGNPLFLQETLRHWTSSGAEAWTGGSVPPTVQDAILARLSRLDAATRRLLEVASLADGSFDAEELADGTALTDLERAQGLEQALDQHVLQRDIDGRLRFRHQLLADALASGLQPERRRALHRRLAAALERHGAAPGRIARHLEAAGASAQALRWHLAAAEAAEGLGQTGPALDEYDAALALEPKPAQAAGIHLRRARVLQRASRPHDADLAFEAAEQAALQAGDGAAVMGAMLAKAEHWTCSSRLEQGLALVDGLLEDGLVLPAQQAEALEIRADVLLRRGEVPAAQALMRDALARLPAGPSLLRGRLLLALGRSAMYRSGFDEAAGHFDKAMRVHAALGAAEGLAKATYMRGAADMNRGRWAAARAWLERARAQAARAGNVPVERGAILNLVKILTQTGEVAAATQALQEGEDLSPFYESRVAEAAFVQARYYCHTLLDEEVQARALLPRVIATSDACEEPYWQVGGRHLVADLLLLSGSLADAERLLREALALCGEGADEHHLALVQAKLAWLEVLRGQARAALDRLQALGRLDAMEPPEARDVRRHVEAAAHLALGDAAAALAAVPAPEASCTEESKALQWAARLEAETALGGARKSTLRAAREMLSRTGRVPAMELAVLRRALDRAEQGDALTGPSPTRGSPARAVPQRSVS